MENENHEAENIKHETQENDAKNRKINVYKFQPHNICMSDIIKRFLEWMTVKEKLHNNDAKPPLVKERDLWWVSFGENVGSEMNGKSKLFSRPGVVIKKLSSGFFLVAPTTSQKKKGTWYAPIKQEGKEVFVCLHQIRTIDYRRLSSRLGQIDSDDFEKIKKAFRELYK